MRGWLNRSLIIIGIFIFVWLSVIYSWRADNHMPNNSEFTFYFIVLPISVLVGIWLVGKVWRLSSAPNKDAELHIGTDKTEHSTEASEHIAELEKSLSIAILAAAIRSPHGNSAEELSVNLLSNEARLNLDPELKDGNGFPVLTSRIAELDENVQLNDLLNWASLNKRDNVIWTSEQLRAISIGGDVAKELAQQVVKHSLLEGYIDIDGRAKNLETLAVPMLQLIILLPESWNSTERSYVADWFSHLIQDQGWPAEKIGFRSEVQPFPLNSMLAIDRLMLDAFRLAQPCLAMVIACESHIGELTIQKWEDEGKLLGRKSAVITVPGEGAAGLLLADGTQAKLFELEALSKLHRVTQGRRTKSADAKGFIGDELMVEMVEKALALSKISVAEIALICSDTDRRSSRMSELLGVGFKIFPELDPDTQYFKLANSCGEMGAVTSLATLVLGHQKVVSDSEVTLCISNNDEYERTVAVLSSWANVTTASTVNT